MGGNTIIQKKTNKVAYYVGCFEENFDNQIIDAVIDIFEDSDYEVMIPKHKCCGLPHLAMGDRAAGLKLARLNFKYLNQCLMEGCEAIIFTCPSCGSTLKREYPRLLGSEANILSEKTYDVFEFLLRAYTENKLHAIFHKISEKIAYFVPCHIKLQKIGTPAVYFMTAMLGASVQKLEKSCCGMGGSYGLKDKNYLRSLEMGDKLFKDIKALSVDRVLTDCAGCRMQIERGTGVKAVHPINLLHERLIKSKNDQRLK